MILAVAIAVPCILVMLLSFAYYRLREKALAYHKLADERLQQLEPMKMERDRFEQRCAFLTARIAELERGSNPSP